MKAEDKVNADLLFTKSHNTGNRGQTMTLVGSELKIARGKYFFTQQISNLWNLLPQEVLYVHLWERISDTFSSLFLFVD